MNTTETLRMFVVEISPAFAAVLATLIITLGILLLVRSMIRKADRDDWKTRELERLRDEVHKHQRLPSRQTDEG